MPVQGLEPRFSKPKNDSKDHPSVIHRTFWKQRSPNKRLSECVYSSLLELFFKRFFGPSFSTSTQPCVNLSTFRLKRCQQKQPRVVSGPETPPEKHQQGVYVRVYIYICTYFKKKYIYIQYTYHWHSKHQITSTPWHSPFSPNAPPAASISTLGGHWASFQHPTQLSQELLL